LSRQLAVDHSRAFTIDHIPTAKEQLGAMFNKYL